MIVVEDGRRADDFPTGALGQFRAQIGRETFLSVQGQASVFAHVETPKLEPYLETFIDIIDHTD